MVRLHFKYIDWLIDWLIEVSPIDGIWPVESMHTICMYRSPMWNRESPTGVCVTCICGYCCSRASVPCHRWPWPSLQSGVSFCPLVEWSSWHRLSWPPCIVLKTKTSPRTSLSRWITEPIFGEIQSWNEGAESAFAVDTVVRWPFNTVDVNSAYQMWSAKDGRLRMEVCYCVGNPICHFYFLSAGLLCLSCRGVVSLL